MPCSTVCESTSWVTTKPTYSLIITHCKIKTSSQVLWIADFHYFVQECLDFSQFNGKILKGNTCALCPSSPVIVADLNFSRGLLFSSRRSTSFLEQYNNAHSQRGRHYLLVNTETIPGSWASAALPSGLPNNSALSPLCQVFSHGHSGGWLQMAYGKNGRRFFLPGHAMTEGRLKVLKVSAWKKQLWGRTNLPEDTKPGFYFTFLFRYRAMH
jgi:hypothetical protein